MRTLTVWADAEELIDMGKTQPPVTYRKFLELEAARINKRGDTVRIVTKERGYKKGCIALTR